MMETFDCLVVEMITKVEWRSAMEDFGEQYVAVVGGMPVMQQLYADNLDSLKEVINVDNMASLIDICIYI